MMQWVAVQLMAERIVAELGLLRIAERPQDSPERWNSILPQSLVNWQLQPWMPHSGQQVASAVLWLARQ